MLFLLLLGIVTTVIGGALHILLLLLGGVLLIGSFFIRLFVENAVGLIQTDRHMRKVQKQWKPYLDQLDKEIKVEKKARKQ